jgi:uncharacterized protein YjiS (DUF1127 family)
MNPRIAQEQIGLFPAQFPATDRMEAFRTQAAAARDAAMALTIGRSFATVWAAIAAIGTAIVTWPERRAAYDALRALSDRELEDIGLTRGDIPRVFDPAFRTPARPANGNQPGGAGVHAA